MRYPPVEPPHVTKARYKALGALAALPESIEYTVTHGCTSRVRIESRVYLAHAQTVRLAQHAQRVSKAQPAHESVVLDPPPDVVPELSSEAPGAAA